MNNLYGYAMCKYLPYGGFEFIEVTDDTIKEALTTPKHSEYGYILDVDMECTKKSIVNIKEIFQWLQKK